ncbi:hypothetical protein [Dongia sp.]|uniref:hypothetical protein n=1 Tax=Dongia sp. TaxID=1977262 RepID=UPI0035B35D52
MSDAGFSALALLILTLPVWAFLLCWLLAGLSIRTSIKVGAAGALAIAVVGSLLLVRFLALDSQSALIVVMEEKRNAESEQRFSRDPGLIVTDIPAVARFREPLTVRVSIERFGALADQRAAIAAANAADPREMAEALPTTELMYVDLMSGDGAFEITRIAPDEPVQFIAKGSSGSWLYRVIPIMGGNHSLEVYAEQRGSGPEGKIVVGWQPYSREISVEVSNFHGVSQFWEDNKKKILDVTIFSAVGAIAAAIGTGGYKKLLAWRKLRAKKRQDIAQAPGPAPILTQEPGAPGLIAEEPSAKPRVEPPEGDLQP